MLKIPLKDLPRVDLHGLDSRVVLCRKLFEDEVRVLVDADEVAGFHVLGVNEADHRQEVGLTGRRLDDGALALK